MEWSLDDRGHLDLSGCFMRRGYDMFAVEKQARLYYFSELTELVAWDGMPIIGMEKENEFLHLICKHGCGRPPLNPLMDIDIERVLRLPSLKAAIIGKIAVDIYRQTRKNKTVDKVEIIVQGEDEDYVVVLGCTKCGYAVRSAYPADKTYIRKIRQSGVLIDSIRP